MPEGSINNNLQVNIKKTDIIKLKPKKNSDNNIENKSSQLNNSDINYKELNEINNINPKIEKNKKKLNKKIKEEKEEIILINDDTDESKKSEPYKKKIIQNKSVDKKGKISKTKKNKEEKNPKAKDIEIHINNNKLNINNNLSFSSNNNDKGNFKQVLFDYKNFAEKVPIKRKKDLDEEELKDIKYQKDLIEKQKKRGWIQKEETIKEKKNKKGKDNNKNQGIKLESFVNESIKENNEIINKENGNKDLNNSDISLLSLDKLSNKEEKENEMKMDIEENVKEKSEENSINNHEDKNKEIEKSVEKMNNNSLDDLLLLDKITDFSHENNLSKYNNQNINKINNINETIDNNNNNSNKKLSQDIDLDFNSNVQSKDKSYNFNNNLVIKNTQEKEEENQKNILEEKNKKLSKFQEYLKFKKLNVNKNDQNNITNPQNYELEIKTQEDQQTYDEFYKMNHNNKKLLGNINKKKLSNNNFMENLPENSRIKKEREKMKGHKCELCQKFYDCLDENAADYLCQECSRHRTDQPINKTPKDFYDLNI